MSDADPETPARPRPTVFLSYASEDRRAAQLIRDTLPAFGLEVWYDESELIGGDAWDQKIRRQIRECTYFMPVISAHTEARHEGYFRREWRLAVERTLDMADDYVFLVPVVIDATAEAGARVPEKFRAVQWLRLPGGQSTAALEALCRRLVSGESEPHSSSERPRTTRAAGAPPGKASGKATRQLPPFPREEPGQRVRFWFQIAGWSLQSVWVGFMRLPGWVRWCAYGWAAVLIISYTAPSSHDSSPRSSPRVSAAQAQKLKEIAANSPSSWTPAETEKFVSQITQQIPGLAGEVSATQAPLLAIPFKAPAGDSAAQQLAGSVFGQVYGRLIITRRGQVALAVETPATLDSSALDQGRAHHATYVFSGAVDGKAPALKLTVQIIAVNDGSVLWSNSYPLSGADPARIAAEVSAHMRRHDDDD